MSIPASVTNIGDFAFQKCLSLKNFLVDPLNTYYSSDDGVLFNLARTTLVMYPLGRSGSYTIPSSVTSIGSQAFYYATKTTSVTIPASVTNISSDAFRYCFSMEEILVDSSNANYSSTNGILFNKNQTLLIQCPSGKRGNNTIPDSVATINDYAFASCTNLTSVIIPDSVLSIGETAFYHCTGMTNLILSRNIATITYRTFQDCLALASITIPESVANIENSAFANCTNLTRIYFTGNSPSLGGGAVFYQDNNLTVFYLRNTAGWGEDYGTRPTILWNPQILNDASFGFKTNSFGFTIAATNNLGPVVVEVCTNLTHPIWLPLQSSTLNSNSTYVSDFSWTNHPSRFYRLRWQ
jgi:hypothetical protein